MRFDAHSNTGFEDEGEKQMFSQMVRGQKDRFEDPFMGLEYWWCYLVAYGVSTLWQSYCQVTDGQATELVSLELLFCTPAL